MCAIFFVMIATHSHRSIKYTLPNLPPVIFDCVICLICNSILTTKLYELCYQIWRCCAVPNKLKHLVNMMFVVSCIKHEKKLCLYVCMLYAYISLSFKSNNNKKHERAVRCILNSKISIYCTVLPLNYMHVCLLFELYVEKCRKEIKNELINS